MRSTFLSRSRKWLGASALAIIVGLGGGSAFLVASAPGVSAQVQNAAQITVPAVTAMPSFADLVEAVKPAVVSIVVETDRARPSIRGGGGQFEFDFPDLPEGHPFRDFFDQFRRFGEPGARPNRPQERMPRRPMIAAGSGFIISADGYVVTNRHVVLDATRVSVTFEDGNQRDAEIVGVDERTDLAVLKIDSEGDLPFVTLSNEDVRVGDWVVAVGNPFGLGGTVTAGIVSARGRDIVGSAYGDFLQIDAAVNTGNSGGPAFNLQGEVVGVNTAIFSPNGGNVGIAFAIPANVVRHVTSQLIERGSVTRGFLGVGIQDVTRDIADGVGLVRAAGALVTEPTAGGPAERAGIRSGDVILSVNGRDIRDALDLSRTISTLDPGTAVNVVYWRDGQEQTVRVTLDTLQTSAEEPAGPEGQPEEAPPVPETQPSSIGVTVVPNAGGQGVLIQDIDPDSPAATRGLEVGDTILEVNNRAVSNARDFEEALESVRQTGRNTALVKAQREGATRFVGLPLDRQ